jgi:hypothetical protein
LFKPPSLKQREVTAPGADGSITKAHAHAAAANFRGFANAEFNPARRRFSRFGFPVERATAA